MNWQQNRSSQRRDEQNYVTTLRRGKEYCYAMQFEQAAKELLIAMQEFEGVNFQILNKLSKGKISKF
jgi:hypothetical protein